MNQIETAVICVDDDPHILQMLSLQLRKCLDSERVLLDFFLDANQVQEHLEKLKEERIKVEFLITDFRMPYMSGYDLIKKTKNSFADVKCILLSGQADEAQVEKLKKEGLLEAFITKPWKEQQLFSLLNCKTL
jgi:CheY-like chemotaxis protein